MRSVQHLVYLSAWLIGKKRADEPALTEISSGRRSKKRSFIFVMFSCIIVISFFAISSRACAAGWREKPSALRCVRECCEGEER